LELNAERVLKELIAHLVNRAVVVWLGSRLPVILVVNLPIIIAWV
jgi:hypothetical protein